ncbi:MAG: 50S ribosomal protein L10 [Lentisphaerae bacterium]|nr:50S ribosomal protein L10 [Lentisphaerota bacterium]
MRPEKESLAEELRGYLDAGDYVFMVDYRGLSVERMTELRARLGSTGAQCHVVKNALLARAGEERGWKIVPEALAGPTAIITGGGDASVVAGMIREFARTGDRPVVKGGMLGATPLSAGEARAMALLPPRRVLLAQLVGTVAAPMSQLAGVLRQKLCSLLYVLRAVEEKKGGTK